MLHLAQKDQQTATERNSEEDTVEQKAGGGVATGRTVIINRSSSQNVGWVAANKADAGTRLQNNQVSETLLLQGHYKEQSEESLLMQRHQTKDLSNPVEFTDLRKYSKERQEKVDGGN